MSVAEMVVVLADVTVAGWVVDLVAALAGDWVDATAAGLVAAWAADSDHRSHHILVASKLAAEWA